MLLHLSPANPLHVGDMSGDRAASQYIRAVCILAGTGLQTAITSVDAVSTQ